MKTRIGKRSSSLLLLTICLIVSILCPTAALTEEDGNIYGPDTSAPRKGDVISLSQGAIVTAAASEGDAYEEDDTFGEAHVIVLNGEPQHHNFHDAGDQDWVKFYGISEEIYEIKVSNAGSKCDAVIELYDTDGRTLLKGPWNWGLEGEEELMDWRCPQDGVYYVMVRNYDSGVSGDGTDYDLQVYRPIGPFPGFIMGKVTDAYSGRPVEGAQIRSDLNGSALSLANGTYLLVHPAGTFTLTASAKGYGSSTSAAVEVPEAGTVTLDFALVPTAQVSDRAPVYRFWSDQIQSHFFTMDEAEKDYIIANYPLSVWEYEGIAWYAYAPEDAPSDAKPIYRYWSDQTGSHFYTISEEEKDYIIANYPDNVWRYEGIAYYAYASGDEPQDAKAVYRFWSDQNGRHFYTINEEERDYVIANYPEQWRYEGIAWYAYDRPQ